MAGIARRVTPRIMDEMIGWNDFEVLIVDRKFKRLRGKIMYTFHLLASIFLPNPQW